MEDKTREELIVELKERIDNEILLSSKIKTLTDERNNCLTNSKAAEVQCVNMHIELLKSLSNYKKDFNYTRLMILGLFLIPILYVFITNLLLLSAAWLLYAIPVTYFTRKKYSQSDIERIASSRPTFYTDKDWDRVELFK